MHMTPPNRILLLVALLTATPMAMAQDDPASEAELAREHRADEWRKRTYTFVLLSTGPATGLDTAVVARHFRGHMDNIGRLAESGDLVVAGPLGKNAHAYRGLFIFSETDTARVRTMLDMDPAIVAGLLNAELYAWYGSAALPRYLPDAKRVQKRRP